MERVTTTSVQGGVALTFDLDVTCCKSEMLKILNLATKLKEYEDAEEQGLLLRLPYPLGTEKIENCNSCNATEKIAELPVLTLAKFSEDLVDMAKENWCESHIIVLRRLILAVQQGTRYDETLLPEEEQ